MTAVQFRTSVAKPLAQLVFPHSALELNKFATKSDPGVKVAELNTPVTAVAFELDAAPAGGEVEPLPSVQVAVDSAPIVAVIVAAKISSGAAVWRQLEVVEVEPDQRELFNVIEPPLNVCISS